MKILWLSSAEDDLVALRRTRELVIPHLPYIIVYTVASEIRILAVFHTSRKWPTVF